MKKIIKSFILLSLLSLVLSSCSTSSKTEAPEVKPTPESTEQVKAPTTPAPTTGLNNAAKNCICVKMYMPVCGSDKKTYGNSCEAECRGVSYTPGACQKKK